MRRLFLLFCIVLFSGCGPSKTSTYVIGVDRNWYPLQLLGLEDNVLAFTIELLFEIAKKEKLGLSITNRSWDNLIEDLQKKQYDAVLSSMRPYTYFEKTYSFSDLYLKTGPVIIAPLASKIRSISDLASREVGVVQGSTSTILLQTIPGLILRPFANITLTLHATRIGQVQAASIPILVAQRFVNDIYSDALKIVSPTLDDEGLRLVTLHNMSPKLLPQFNRGLHKLMKDGTYTSLLAKWGLSPDSKSPSKKTIQAYINTHIQ